MSKQPKIGRGKTPWDDLPKEQLLREVQRMYSALQSLQSVANMTRTMDSNSSYWGKEGTGGAALEKARQILEPLHKRHGSEEIWRAFFRYADDLLFDLSTGFRIGSNWTVCPKCGTMLGDSKHIGKKHGHLIYPDCDGVMERLTWQHLKAAKD